MAKPGDSSAATNASSSVKLSKGNSSESSKNKAPQKQALVPPSGRSPNTATAQPSPSLHPHVPPPMIPPFYPMSSTFAFPPAASSFNLEMGFHHARRMIAIEQEQQRIFAWRMNQLHEHRARMEKRALQQRQAAEERLRKKRRRLNPPAKLITTSATTSIPAKDEQGEGRKVAAAGHEENSACFPLPSLSTKKNKKDVGTVRSLDRYRNLWKDVSKRADKLFGGPKDKVNNHEVKQAWIRHYFAKGLDSNVILRKPKENSCPGRTIEDDKKKAPTGGSTG